MSEPSVRCPLCQRVVKIVVHPTNYSGRAVEEHPYDGGLAEFISYECGNAVEIPDDMKELIALQKRNRQ